jgi:hypothetical protein
MEKICLFKVFLQWGVGIKENVGDSEFKYDIFGIL